MNTQSIISEATDSATTAQAPAVKLKDSERQACEVWTRVMGYHRPVSSFNIGKKGEHLERKFFLEARCSER
jgi:hypothetical protein